MVRLGKIRVKTLIDTMRRAGAKESEIRRFDKKFNNITAFKVGLKGWAPFGTHSPGMSSLFPFSGWNVRWLDVMGDAQRQFIAAVEEESRDVLSPLYGLK